MSRFALVPFLAGRHLRIFLLAACMSFPSAGLAQDGSGAGSHLDPVTGYRCVDRFCTVVHLQGTNCLCAKQNPSETVLARLRLRCTEGRQACPVRPRYGN